MEHTKLALSAVMIVAVGLIGTNFVTGLEMTDQEKFDTNLDSGAVFGHVTVVHSGPDGNILSYAQTDNLVANLGKDCMAELVFGNQETSCESAGTSVFNTIVLFDGQSFPIEMNVTDANNLLTVDISATGLGIFASTVTSNANATGTGYVDGTGSLTDIENTFTAGTNVAAQNVDGAALFNDDEDAVLAGQVFTAVSLNEDDTLKITWTITLG